MKSKHKLGSPVYVVIVWGRNVHINGPYVYGPYTKSEAIKERKLFLKDLLPPEHCLIRKILCK